MLITILVLEYLFEFMGVAVDVSCASLYAGRRSRVHKSRPGHPDFSSDSWPCVHEAVVGDEWNSKKGVK